SASCIGGEQTCMLNREPMLETSPIEKKPILPPDPPSSRGRTWRVVLLLVVAAVIVADVVFSGINARIQTAAAVKETTRELAIPAVAIIHPKPGATKDEVVLPGNIQAFTDSPIYARASGYLKQ